ncbi:MAG TPA: glycosyltransferase [Flavobacteriales bacterium]|nr:glycosyltransferase [Flavobacteriales bacterium]HHZ95543.1 glycosyltransferase [Flavobacteriales bacterium]HIB77594.1 glycosyltransferase [Flavobacteriales bacterium]HIN42029.1 glycosyltransferase [Flavobacteriales bacterium]HIO16456.1 glycosyltransferase [Flavobacteriales bacterium]
MDISIVIPLYNEAESLPELMAWIDRVLRDREYEIVFVDDGSKDNSWDVITQLSYKYTGKVKAIRFARNYGKSAGLQKGFEEATGKVVFTMDADLQDSPDEILVMEKELLDKGLDLVSGWKKKRHDPLTKTIPTKLYNWMTRRVSGIMLHDFNCGLKCYKLDVVKAIEVQGEMHRYIPLLAKDAGFDKIGEYVVEHQARKYGTTKFGLERFTNGMLDLMTIAFVQRFGRKPMHLFGFLGTLTFALSFLLFATIGGYKVYAMSQGLEAKNITEISAFYVALTGMVLGSQLFLSGFIAEMVSRTNPSRTDYRISEKLG